MFKDTEGPKLRQLEDILRTYLMYNVDLGKGGGVSHDRHVTTGSVTSAGLSAQGMCRA